MSFGVVLTLAVVATVAIVGVGIFAPTFVGPVVLLALAGGAGLVTTQFLRRRGGGTHTGASGPTTYPLHSLSRTKATLEAHNTAEKPNVPELVDYMLQQATLQQASDVHLVPYRDHVLVRFRIDGILTDVAQLRPHLREIVTNRLKVMAQAVTFVHDRPQDGRIDLMVGERDVDLRVAFMPTLHGERIVLRILDRADVGYGLESLGLTPEQLALFTDLVFRPQGMVIMNGPAGSGKTTTIYAVLRAIHEKSQHSTSIYTLEDPIEGDLANINQTQIEETQGFTFAHGLRTMLRQDPDVIMVGEIRDLDTARIAVQAGMTGHLIITTVHAKQASAVFVRLAEIGVDSHSVASAVTVVVAQRLVRMLCPKCKRPATVTPGQEAKLGQALAGHRFFESAGCPSCNHKGYLGRRGVFEILGVDESVRELIAERASPDRLQRDAVERGMTTLIDNALRLARQGETSLEEVLRILPPEQRGA